MEEEKAVHLAPSRPSVSDETVAKLEELLDLARRGELLGIAGVLVFRGVVCSTCVEGAVWEHPTFIRGWVRNLEDQIAAIINVHPRQL